MCVRESICVCVVCCFCSSFHQLKQKGKIIHVVLIYTAPISTNPIIHVVLIYTAPISTNPTYSAYFYSTNPTYSAYF